MTELLATLLADTRLESGFRRVRFGLERVKVWLLSIKIMVGVRF